MEPLIVDLDSGALDLFHLDQRLVHVHCAALHGDKSQLDRRGAIVTTLPKLADAKNCVPSWRDSLRQLFSSKRCQVFESFDSSSLLVYGHVFSTFLDCRISSCCSWLTLTNQPWEVCVTSCNVEKPIEEEVCIWKSDEGDTQEDQGVVREFHSYFSYFVGEGCRWPKI